MLLFLLLKHGCSVAEHYDYCIYATVLGDCPSDPSTLTFGQTLSQTEVKALGTAIVVGKKIYFASPLTIDPDTYAKISPVFVSRSAFSIPDTVVVKDAVEVTFSPTSPTYSDFTLTKKSFSFTSTTITTTGSCDIDFTLLKGTTTVQVAATKALKLKLPTSGSHKTLFSGGSQTFSFLGASDVTLVFEGGLSPKSINLVTANEMTLMFAGSPDTTLVTDLPTDPVTLKFSTTNALNLVAQGTIPCSISLTIDTGTQSITVDPTTSVNSNLKPITILGLSAPITVALPLTPTEIATQKLFAVPNLNLNLVNEKYACVFDNTNPIPNGCKGYVSVSDADQTAKTQLQNKDFILFLSGSLDITALPSLDLDNVKYAGSTGLTITVSKDFADASLDAVFPDWATFGSLTHTVTLQSLQIEFSGLPSGTDGSIIAPTTINLKAATDAVGSKLKIIDPSKEAILKYDVSDLSLTGFTAPKINEKEITLDHSFTISSKETLESFSLTWIGDNTDQINKIKLIAAPTTKFSIGKGYSSTGQIVGITFQSAKPTTVEVISSENDNSQFVPFVCDSVKFNIIKKVIICIYPSSGGTDEACQGLGETGTASDAVSSLEGATKIIFTGHCPLDISKFGLLLDFSQPLYSFPTSGTDKLLLSVQDADTLITTPIILTSNVLLKTGLKATSLTTPITSIDSSLSVNSVVATTVILQEVVDGAISIDKFSTTSSITITPAAPKTELTLGSTVSFGGITFTVVPGQKYTFDTAPFTTLTVTNSLISGTSDQFTIPVTDKTKLTLQGTYDVANLLTLSGLDQVGKFSVLYSGGNAPTKSPLLPNTVSYSFYDADKSFCIYANTKAVPSGCGPLTSQENSFASFSLLTFIRIIGHCTCPLTDLVESNVITFDGKKLEFIDDATLTIGSEDEAPDGITSVTLVDQVTIGQSFTTDSLICPLSCLPTATFEVTIGTRADISIPIGEISKPISSNVLECLKSTSPFKLNLIAVASKSVSLDVTYDSSEAPSYTFYGYKFMKVPQAPIFKSQQTANSLKLSLSGSVAISDETLIGTAVVTTDALLSLGTGFDVKKGNSIFTLEFTPSPPSSIYVSVQSDYTNENKPFTNAGVAYDKPPTKICLYVPPSEVTLLDTVTSCSSLSPEYTGYANNDVQLTKYLPFAEKIMIGESMTMPASAFYLNAQLTIGTKYEFKDGTAELTIAFSVATYELVLIEVSKGVILSKADSTANILAGSTEITTLQCHPESIKSFAADVTTLNLYVDSSDKTTYEFFGEAKVNIQSQVSFCVTGDSASVVFKPSTKATPMIQIGSSEYNWPSSVQLELTNSFEGASTLSSVDVDLVKSDGATTIPEKSMTLSVATSATVKILKGFDTQTQNPFEFPASTSNHLSITVQYPDTFPSENQFVKETEGLTVTTAQWSPEKPSPTKDGGGGLEGWAIAVIVIVVVIVVAVVVVLVLNFTGVIHLCGNKDDAPSV